MRIIFLILLLVGSAGAVPDEDSSHSFRPLLRLTALPIVVDEPTRSPFPQVVINDSRTTIADREITSLIDRLIDFGKSDIDLLSSHEKGGRWFLPVGEFDFFGKPILNRTEGFQPIEKLVDIGPETIPFLIDSLADERETKLVIKAEPRLPLLWTRMWFDGTIVGNPLSPIEQSVLGINRSYWTSRSEPIAQIEAYRAKVGDVCFSILGQIVGRDYEPISRYHAKSPGIVICSPVCDEDVRTKITRIWKNVRPRRLLLESLLLDFATRNVFDGQSLDDWDIGTHIQLNAVMRLLYYYPEESCRLVSDRLDQLEVIDGSIEETVTNGIWAGQFVDAVGWCQHPVVREALNRLAGRAKDRRVVDAVMRAAARDVGK